MEKYRTTSDEYDTGHCILIYSMSIYDLISSIIILAYSRISGLLYSAIHFVGSVCMGQAVAINREMSIIREIQLNVW